MEVLPRHGPDLSGPMDNTTATGAANRPRSAAWDWRCTLASIVVLAVYLLVLWALPLDVFWSPDEGAKLLQMEAMTLDNGFRWQIAYPGQRLDPAFDFYPSWNVYPQLSEDCTARAHWPIWFGLFSLIPYRLFGIPGLYVLPLVGGLGTAALSGLLTRRFRPALAPLAILLVGLASPVVFYSVLFWEHTVVTFLGLLALWQLLRLPDRQHPWVVVAIAGVCLLLASALKSEMVVYSLCLVVATVLVLARYHRRQSWVWMKAAVKQDRWRAMAAVVALVALFWVLFFSQTVWEQPTATACDTGRSVEQPGSGSMPRSLQTQIRWAIYRLETLPSVAVALERSWFSAVDAPHSLQSGWIGFLGVCMCMLGGVLFRLPAGRWLLLVGAGLVIAATHQILFYPDRYRFIHALFLPAPFTALASLFVLVVLRQRRYDSSLLFLMTMSYLLLGTLMIIARGAYVAYTHPEWGARYLLPLYPLLIVCALLGIDEASRRIRAAGPSASLRYPTWFLLLVVMLVGQGAAFAWRGVSELQQSKQDLSAYQAAISQEARPVVTNLPWLPSALAAYYITHEMYVLNEEHGMNQWLDLANSHVQSFVCIAAPGPPPAALTSWDGGSGRLRVRDSKLVNGFVFWDIALD